MRKGLTLIILTCLTLIGCQLSTFQQMVLPDEIAAFALDKAISVVDAPYVYGQRGPTAFDCSGLVTWSYREVYPALRFKIGSSIANDANAAELWRYNVILVEPSIARPGDLVFFANTSGVVEHVGLFKKLIDDSVEFINASSYFGCVTMDVWPLSGFKREQIIVGFGKLQTVIRD